MNAQLVAAPWAKIGDDDLHHLYCCDPDRALCGRDISDIPHTDPDETGELLCAVCYTLEDADCTFTCKETP